MKRAVSLSGNGVSAGEGVELCVIVVDSKRANDWSQDTLL